MKILEESLFSSRIFDEYRKRSFDRLSEDRDGITMTDTKYLPRIVSAIASSYLIEQTAGSESIGGLEVKVSVLRPDEIEQKSAQDSDQKSASSIRSKNTFYADSQTWPDIDSIKQAAIHGIVDYAQEQAIDLSRFDIEIRKFLFHPVNSKEAAYYTAAQIAFSTAIKTLRQRKTKINPSRKSRSQD